MPTLGPLYVVIALLYLVLLVVLCLIGVHIAVAVAVYRDAQELRASAIGLSPVMWALLSFSVPGVGLLCYWLMNHSTLSRR